jgi:hypothetical protein
MKVRVGPRVLIVARKRKIPAPPQESNSGHTVCNKSLHCSLEENGVTENRKGNVELLHRKKLSEPEEKNVK